MDTSKKFPSAFTTHGNEGLVTLMVVIGFNMFVDVVAKSTLGMPDFVYDIRNAYPWLWMVGMFLSALFCWFYGKHTEKAARREAVKSLDAPAGETACEVYVPEFLWLPVKWWAVTCLLLGVILWQSYTH